MPTISVHGLSRPATLAATFLLRIPRSSTRFAPGAHHGHDRPHALLPKRIGSSIFVFRSASSPLPSHPDQDCPLQSTVAAPRAPSCLWRGKIALHNRFLMRMRRQPSLAFAQQFFDFILANPIVLFRIEHRHEHIKMVQQILQPNRPWQRHRVVRPFAPLRELLIQRMVLGADAISQRLKQSLASTLSPPRQATTASVAVSGIGWSANSCLPLLRPVMAVPNARPIATLRNDDST